ncbi:Lrp/AsnC family transcriptional regulator [Candidatus Pacearchaeota archaeon]|nr:Lrp/AsnC family transcriptional regulator [Candidatus Pacearchaeota archaeon]
MEDFKGSNLSPMEKRVLKELDIDARQGISSIGSKLKISKQAVTYHIEKMKKKGFIKEFLTYYDTNKLGYTFYNIVIKLKYTTKDNLNNVIGKLKAIPNVVWVSTFRGEWQMIVSILAKDVGEFSFYLEEVLSSLKGNMLDYHFFIVLSASQLGYKKLHSKVAEKHDSRVKHSKISKEDMVVFSDNDLKVLGILANNAQMSIVDIAKNTGLTIEKARYSLKKMEAEKVIQGYKPLVDVAKLGYLWNIMFLRLKSSSEAEKKKMIDFLEGMHEVCYVVRCVGNCNLMIDIHTKTLDELEEIKDKISNEFSKIIAYERTVQVVNEYKCTYFPGSLGN